MTEEVPLREVLQQLGELSRKLNVADDEISKLLQRIQDGIRVRWVTGHPVDVPFPPWGKLGWSGRRGRWRLVVIDDEECEDLISMPRQCRTEACLVLQKLVERMKLL